MLQDLGLQLGQPRARFQPELLGELHPRPLIHLERIGLPPGAVQGEHQLRGDPFA